jgi:hypothetical protein
VPATTQGQNATGASATWANAETGAKFNREDTLAGTTPVPAPTATGTNYSWRKYFALAVTATSTTSISNRRLNASSAPSTGLTLWYRTYAVASYAQAAVGNMPAAGGTNGATPAVAGTPATPAYAAVPTTATQYDAASVATSATGPNGQLLDVVCGVDNLYTGGANNAAALPNIVITYDEA